MLFPNSPIVLAIFLVLYALAGIAIGIVCGWLTTLVTKCRPWRFMKDATLGSVGFIAGFMACAFIPWHENTIRYTLTGGTQVTSTMSRYQHPERIAIALAVALPVMYELYRLRRARE